MPADDLINLVNKIKTELEGIETTGVAGNAKSGVKFKQVFTRPTTKYDALPAAHILESDIESDFDTQNTNLRVYPYQVYLVCGLELEGWTVDECWDTCRELYARTLDAFDNSNDLDAECDILEPSTMPWDFARTNLGLALVATLTLRCKKEVAAHQYLGE